MKYYKWKLNGDALPPFYSGLVKINPAFKVGYFIYSYEVEGKANLTNFTTWQMVEITIDEMLVAAKTHNPNAVINGEWIDIPLSPVENFRYGWNLSYPSWTFDSVTMSNVPPIPMPIDGKMYSWDEPTLAWVVSA